MRAVIVPAGSTVRVRTALALAAVAAAVAYYAGWAYWRPDPGVPVAVTHAKAIPGGLRLGNTPAAPGEAPKPSRRLPVGRKADTVATLRIQPRPLPGAPAGCECKTIDLELVASHGRDGQPVAEAFTDDARITAGTYTTPAVLPVMPAKRPWLFAVGAGQSIGGGDRPAGSVLVARDVGPFWVGAQATYTPDTGAVAFVHVGVRFR